MIGRTSLALAILAATAAPVMAQTAVSVDPTGQVCQPGDRILLSGTVQCPAGYTGGVSIFVRAPNRAARSIATGFGSTGITCTGSPQSYQVTINADSLLFPRSGTATAFADLFVCDQSFENCVSAFTQQAITLRPVRCG